jgi:hypothetical protein
LSLARPAAIRRSSRRHSFRRCTEGVATASELATLELELEPRDLLV